MNLCIVMWTMPLPHFLYILLLWQLAQLSLTLPFFIPAIAHSSEAQTLENANPF